MDRFIIKNAKPNADPSSIIQGDKYRFTVLTERMIRMEYSADGRFADGITQAVINRDFPVPDFKVSDSEDRLEIITSCMKLTYDKQPFSSSGLQIRMLGNRWLRKQETWFYGDKEFEEQGNLKGTYFNLDGCDGDLNWGPPGGGWAEPARIDLGVGLMSSMGFSVIDDSADPVLDIHGWPAEYDENRKDIYFLNYGRDYLGLLKDFYHLSGKQPMIPRFILGNWWSRYYSYTQEEYMELMDAFEAHGIPLSMSVFDMGWHLVDIDPKYGKGWTGYTWNTDLFPDHEGMLKELHDRGKHVTLNVHPADGVRAFESMYPKLAEAMGIDPASELPVEFDATDKKFWKAYFDIIHHPMEEEGVDFWWMDWQQGGNSRGAGFDPQWMLNQYHYLDIARDGKRGMAFSRYGGLGSHRYPIGFSGSTKITWRSLQFQPYFTATASNLGYGWYSHDIGGHRGGISDDELAARWVQFGTFSPIMRLHSSNDIFNAREPWKYTADCERVMTKFLRLRHRMVPYIYTMNYRAWHDDRPLIEPVYYLYPDKREAYEIKNEYFFGSELLVDPVTHKKDSETTFASELTWIPEGRWTDVFTGIAYKGGRMIKLHRDIDSIPVFAKAGAVIPLASEDTIGCSVDAPDKLDICVFAGADGCFSLYEDDGVSCDYLEGKCAFTDMRLKWGEQKAFEVDPVRGEKALSPASRDITVCVYGVTADAAECIEVGNASRELICEYDKERHILKIKVGRIEAGEGFKISFRKDAGLADNPLESWAYKVIRRAEIDFAVKEELYAIMCSKHDVTDKITAINTKQVSDEMKSCLFEILTAV